MKSLLTKNYFKKCSTNKLTLTSTYIGVNFDRYSNDIMRIEGFKVRIDRIDV